MNIPNITLNLLRPTTEVIKPKPGQNLVRTAPVFAKGAINGETFIETLENFEDNTPPALNHNRAQADKPKKSPPRRIRRVPDNGDDSSSEDSDSSSGDSDSTSKDSDSSSSDSDSSSSGSDNVAAPAAIIKRPNKEAPRADISQFWTIIQELNWTNRSDMVINQTFVQDKINAWSDMQKNTIRHYYPILMADVLALFNECGVFEARQIQSINTQKAIISHFIGLGEEWYNNCIQFSDFVSIIIDMGDYQDLNSLLNNVVN